jgi:hypothetical protein
LDILSNLANMMSPFFKPFQPLFSSAVFPFPEKSYPIFSESNMGAKTIAY